MIKNSILFLVFTIAAYSCSPLKSSPKEEKHQMELTLHELQTNLDDLRHDLNCFQTELQIIDTKMKNQESESNNIKHYHIERIQNKLESLSKQISLLENKQHVSEKQQINASNDLTQLTNHANETTLALTQHKNRMTELENTILSQNKSINEVAKLKSTLETIAKSMRENKTSFNVSYIVKPGDSLDKIAKKNKTSVEAIKTMNNLENDLIVIGQELKIPHK